LREKEPAESEAHGGLTSGSAGFLFRGGAISFGGEEARGNKKTLSRFLLLRNAAIACAALRRGSVELGVEMIAACPARMLHC